MDRLKVLFVGVGSIATRHISNLKSICEEQARECQIDVFRSGIHKELPVKVESYITKVYLYFDEVPSDYDVIFITNPTEYHLDTLKKFNQKGKHFFIEKPICSIEQLSGIGQDFIRKESVYYVACPLRYTSVIQYLKNNINFEDVFSIRCISSSYLPEWRKNVDYRETYSAHKALGGGVSIDLIHEWDYLCYLLGKPKKIYSIIEKISDLEIDSDDIAIYIARYDKMVVELHLDYFGRKPIRQIQLFTKEDTLLCDLIESNIVFMKTGKRIEFNQQRDDYQKKELNYFLEIIGRKKENINCIEYACDTLKLTKGVI